MTTTFSVTWDYRCPFARNAHEHVVEGLRAGADWDVRFVPFSLGQVHVKEGEPDVWDDETKAPGLLATQAGLVVRDRFPEKFLDAHIALFSARFDKGGDIRDRDVVKDALDEAGVDSATILAGIDDGWPLEQFRKEHEAAAGDHRVWGVPTFIHGDEAVFVRLMHRPQGDGALATRTVERVVDLVGGWPELNEFKHTSIPR
jgi:protein-disulfide isomerase-like protein with CxxC motif